MGMNINTKGRGFTYTIVEELVALINSVSPLLEKMSDESDEKMSDRGLMDNCSLIASLVQSGYKRDFTVNRNGYVRQVVLTVTPTATITLHSDHILTQHVLECNYFGEKELLELGLKDIELLDIFNWALLYQQRYFLYTKNKFYTYCELEEDNPDFEDARLYLAREIRRNDYLIDFAEEEYFSDSLYRFTMPLAEKLESDLAQLTSAYSKLVAEFDQRNRSVSDNLSSFLAEGVYQY